MWPGTGEPSHGASIAIPPAADGTPLFVGDYQSLQIRVLNGLDGLGADIPSFVMLTLVRHAERVSASIGPWAPTSRGEEWTLKHVQGDDEREGLLLPFFISCRHPELDPGSMGVKFAWTHRRLRSWIQDQVRDDEKGDVHFWPSAVIAGTRVYKLHDLLFWGGIARRGRRGVPLPRS